ncbi:MAG TPA: dynamin family protein [Pseudonocardiaceae bacterium]|nr:dynamin family protein [Pseudonocardiaceae bacterium]
MTLPRTVRQAIGQLLALVREQDPAAADGVDRAVAARPATPTVVVVGETKRGKSSLVNALLACPGLSPVDADVATSAYLVFGHAEAWQASAHYPGQLPPMPFDLAQLRHWASADGELPAGQVPPAYVEVAGPVPLLARLTLVDTPGVGGLDTMHGDLARQAAAGATALLFVVDASGPLTSGELAFLRDVGERVETVVFAMAKTDAFPGWRQVLEADRALLAEHASRFASAPWFACSARLAELAGAAPNEQAAATLRQHSGIAELQAALQDLVVGRSVMLAEANTLRALDTALAGLAATLRAECRALSSGAAEAEQLRAHRDELAAARRSSTRGWQVRLRGEIQRARVESSHEVQRRMRDVQSWFRHAIDSADRTRLAGLPGQVDAALRSVSYQLSVELARRLDRVAVAALADLFTEDELALIRAQAARAGRPSVVSRPPDRRPPTAEDRLLVFMGITGGFGAARVAALPLAGLGVAVLNPLVLPVTIVVGLGAGWWLARTRKHTADKQHMKQWLTESIADARATLDQLVAEQLIEVEQSLSLALDDALGRRIDAIEAELREVDAAMRLADGERTRLLAEAGKRLAAVRQGRERIEGLLADIRALRDAPADQAGQGNRTGIR